MAYLKGRDGIPNLQSQRFDVREKFFDKIDSQPLQWQGQPLIDQSTFDRNHALHRPERGLDEATLWALATAKANRGERYGVEYALKHAKPASVPEADPHAYVMIEEFYHTRILKDALATLGLRMEIAKPSLSARVLVRAMVRLPDDIADVVVLCGEIVGVAIFGLLLEKGRELFAAQPAVLGRIESLFAQILVDEVGHVHFVRSRLSPRGIAWAKRLLPVIGRGVLDDIPELQMLFGRETFRARVLAANVDAAAAPYPDRFVLETH